MSAPIIDAPVSPLRQRSRYTHRVAISNLRLLAFDSTSITFRYKDIATPVPSGSR